MISSNTNIFSNPKDAKSYPFYVTVLTTRGHTETFSWSTAELRDEAMEHMKTSGCTILAEGEVVVKVNILSRKEFVQDKNTPPCCDPSTELYWAM